MSSLVMVNRRDSGCGRHAVLCPIYCQYAPVLRQNLETCPLCLMRSQDVGIATAGSIALLKLVQDLAVYRS